MADKTSIEWTDATWSPIRAKVKEDAAKIAEAKGYASLINIASKMAGHVGPHCERCSDGCDNCYSDTNNHRCLPSNGTGLPFDRRARDLVDIFVDEDALTQPLRWKKGRRIFVENQSDLFGEWVPDEMIDRIFAVMALCPQHTFQVLTKRASWMREYFSDLGRVGEEVSVRVLGLWKEHVAPTLGAPGPHEIPVPRFPLSNVWLGVSVEDQERKDRIDILKQTPSAVRFISFEPLLEDLGDLDLRGIDLAIWGGESGSSARECRIRWISRGMKQARRDHCRNFVKQLGGNLTESDLAYCTRESGRSMQDPKGGEPEEWPRSLRVRQMPKAKEAACRV